MTDNRLIFTIPGNPKAKARPRVTRSGHAYTPAQTIEYENLVRMSFVSEWPEWKPSDLHVHASIIAFFEIPKSFSKKKRIDISVGKLYPTKKPDADNIAKSILDSLNGIAYHDDSQVVELNVTKLYSEYPRVEVMLIFGEEI